MSAPSARSAIRTVARTPAASLLVIAVLAVAIGASVAIFALADAALLKPLPYPHADRLVAFAYTFNGRLARGASEAKFVAWQQTSTTVEDAAALTFRSAEIGTSAGPRRIRTAAVSAAFFQLFGVPFASGRPFTASENGQAPDDVVVLAHRFWQQQYGGDPAVLGRQLNVDGRRRTVIGVVARDFDASLFGDTPDLWEPLRLSPANLANLEHSPFLQAFARLRPGVSLEQARLDDRRAADEFRRRYPGVMAAEDVFLLRPFSDATLASLRRPLGFLAAAVALLLALGCVNVAGLLLVQMSARRREMAVRTALGGSRGQIAAQLLAESAVLSGAAGGLGLLLGLNAARALVTLAPGIVPRLPDGAASLTIDVRLGAFVCLLAAVTTVACTVLPALASTSGPIDGLLRGGGRSPRGSDRRGVGTRTAIVAVQVALATVLAIGAALLGRSWWSLQTVDRGFNPRDVATMRVGVAAAGEEIDAGRVAEIVRTGVQRLSTVEGVVTSAATCCLPLESDWLTSLRIPGAAAAATVDELASERRISPSYFDVLEIPLVRGRRFDDRDSTSALPVAIVNQAFARRFWPDQEVIGTYVQPFPGRIPDADSAVRTIVGVVADVRDGLPMAERARPTVYVPLAQLPNRQQEPALTWIVRHRASRYDAAGAERALRVASGGRAVFDVGSLDGVGAAATADTTIRAALLGLFGAGALFLAVVGVYGAVAANVRQRWHEMGIRLALGASPGRLRDRTVRDAVRLVAAGAIAGLLAALAAGRAIATFLFGVSVHDPLAFAGAAAILGALAVAAAWIPASHVVRLNVMDVLRGD